MCLNMHLEDEMKHKAAIKAVLDIFMTLIFALLFNKMILGLVFHEAAGLAIGMAIIVHLFLNWKWIVIITKKFFAREIPMRTKVGYLLNFSLLIGFLTIIVSGIFISKVFLVSIRGLGSLNYKTIHIIASYVTLVLIGVHIGLHWAFIKQMSKRLCPKMNASLRKGIAIVLLIGIIFGGGYSFVQSGFVSKFTMGGGKEHAIMSKGEERFDNAKTANERGEGPSGDREGFDKLTKPQGFNGIDQISAGNVASVIGTYVSLMALIALITGIVDQWIIKRKRRNFLEMTEGNV